MQTIQADDKFTMIDFLADIPTRGSTSSAAEQIFLEKESDLVTKVNQQLEQAFQQYRKFVLVYQMGKAGSSTYTHKLTENKGLFVLHSHRLNPAQSNLMLQHYLKNRLPQRALRERQWQETHNFIKNLTSPVFIVSSMREPVARNISAYFQNYEVAVDADPHQLIDEFFDKYPHHVPLEWFETQLNETFGLDIYQYQFHRELGWGMIKKNNYHCLLMTAESEDRDKINALNQFLGLDLTDLPHQNTGELKSYADLYSKFKMEINIRQTI